MKKTICQLALLLTVASLSGCGLKGPLYFPQNEPPKSQVTQPAPATPSADARQTTTPATTNGQSAQPAQ
ncbi:lipoprotein [Erwinia sp. Eh17-17]|jgi:predicted small lipoprotein YifL|uniref:LPS translocon maturation chaperone LptM n=1 Tax=Erwinia sp. Eh17-17 TaxID=3080330 RepID=UPI00320A7207